MKTSKTITMEQDLADRIQELAEKERRSFTRQVDVILETALARITEQASAPAA